MCFKEFLAENWAKHRHSKTQHGWDDLMEFLLVKGRKFQILFHHADFSREIFTRDFSTNIKDKPDDDDFFLGAQNQLNSLTYSNDVRWRKKKSDFLLFFIFVFLNEFFSTNSHSTTQKQQQRKVAMKYLQQNFSSFFLLRIFLSTSSLSIIRNNIMAARRGELNCSAKKQLSSAKSLENLIKISKH